MWGVGLRLEGINLAGYHQAFEENGANGECLESIFMFTTEQTYQVLLYETERLYHTL